MGVRLNHVQMGRIRKPSVSFLQRSEDKEARAIGLTDIPMILSMIHP